MAKLLISTWNLKYWVGLWTVQLAPLQNEESFSLALPLPPLTGRASQPLSQSAFWTRLTIRGIQLNHPVSCETHINHPLKCPSCHHHRHLIKVHIWPTVQCGNDQDHHSYTVASSSSHCKNHISLHNTIWIMGTIIAYIWALCGHTWASSAIGCVEDPCHHGICILHKNE